MKKLMIAACAVAFAAAAQAATYNWNAKFNAVYNGYDSTAAIGSAWSSATETAGLNWYLIAVDSYSQSSILETFRGGTTDLTSYALKSGTTTTAGQALTETFTADTSLVRSDDKMYTYLAVISDDGKSIFLGKEAGTTANTSEEGVATLQPTTGLATKKLMDADGKTAYGSAGWYTKAVPEPTSGLLLLLGMAGLALRRRRA